MANVRILIVLFFAGSSVVYEYMANLNKAGQESQDFNFKPIEVRPSGRTDRKYLLTIVWHFRAAMGEQLWQLKWGNAGNGNIQFRNA